MARPCTARRQLCAGLLVSGLAGSCGFEPAPPERAYALAPATQAVLEDDARALAGLAAGLLEAFGPPAAPRYALPEAWAAQGLDPNHPDRARGAGGSGELGASDRAQIEAGNAREFARQLGALAGGDFDAVRVASRRPALRAAWQALRAERDAGRIDDAALVARGRELFLSWYPDLVDSAALYRAECLHCHGLEGGGDGPSAAFLEPRPRDFRQGVFKYTSRAQPARPSRADLLRTLEAGVNGTSMPSFARLSPAERHGLADLVRLLSVRGEVERRLAATLAEEGEIEPEAISTETEDLLGKWLGPSVPVVAESDCPPSTPELVARGAALFRDATKGNCASCHGEAGAGDGPAAWKIGLSGRREPAYLDAWDRPILPRDLRRGLYRGGSRPIDLYRRIWNGIPGTPMPALGTAKGPDGSPAVTSSDVWALVHFVRSLDTTSALER